MVKPRIVKDYEKLPLDVVEQIKIVYPRGYLHHLVSFVNKEGDRRMGLPFETEDYYYLIRMSKVKAEEIIENDDDYDDDGILKSDVKDAYEEKHEDVEFLEEYNSNEDNTFGEDGDGEEEESDG